MIKFNPDWFRIEKVPSSFRFRKKQNTLQEISSTEHLDVLKSEKCFCDLLPSGVKFSFYDAN